MKWAQFLEQVPPGTQHEIEDMCEYAHGLKPSIPTTPIELHCETCQGDRTFRQSGATEWINSTDRNAFLYYICGNCHKSIKIFAVRMRKSSETEFVKSGIAIKFGELPSFGPVVPARVISLIGPDRDLFLKGRRAENQGLGIGAFAYYRQVVEQQKGRLIGKIAEVARRQGVDQSILDLLSHASKETQFKKAVDSIKDAIPQSLLIDGHNPIALLHSALSEGLHGGTDEECLELATSIRIVLTVLSERISVALKDHSELQGALSNLLSRKKKSDAS